MIDYFTVISNMKKLLFSVSFFLSISIVGYTQTINFSGTISFDTTWSADTVKITGDIWVNNVATLTINQGTYVEFQSFYSINVSGRILSIGNSNDSITFTIKDTTGLTNYSNNLGGWNGIHLFGLFPTNDSSIFEYCKFSYCKYTSLIPYNGQHIRIESCSFNNNGGAIDIENNIHSLIKKNYFRNNLTGLFVNANSNSIISENTFQNNGYGILFYNSSAMVNNNIISHSTDFGIQVSDTGSTSVTITQNEITYNLTGIKIVEASNSHIIINKNIINYNNAMATGGGIFIFSASPTIINNTIAYNNATGGSGILINNYSKPLIIFNKICNNQATGFGCGYQDDGAGILSIKSFPFIINNLICNNEAENAGGGISILDTSSATIINNTIVNNRSNQLFGGGVSIAMDSGDVVFKNNIIFGNESSQTYNGGSSQIFAYTGSTPFDVGYCDFSDTTNVSGYHSANYNNIILSDPLFISPTADAGISYDALSANWDLQTISPCTNTGTPDTNGLYLYSTDIIGNSRVKFGRIDMGAYESTTLLTTSITNLMNSELISIFPNPVKDNLFMTSNEKIKNIMCLNYLGQSVDLKLENNSVITSTLSEGMYFLILTTQSEKNIIKRFIKE